MTEWIREKGKKIEWNNMGIIIALAAMILFYPSLRPHF